MSTRKSRLSIPLLCSLAWFGHACGSSMATGRLAVQYCTRHGVLGIFSAVLIWVFTAVWIFITMEYARITKARNYRDIVTGIYWDNRVVGKAAGILWDWVQAFSIIIVSGSCVSGSGAVLESVLGINYVAGMFIFGLLILILFISGSDILGKLGKMSLPLFILLVIIASISLMMGRAQLLDVFAGKYRDAIPQNAGTWPAVFKDSLTYAAAQLGFIATAAPYAAQFESRRDTVKTVAIGFSIGCFGLLITTIATLAHFPQCLEETLPILSVLTQIAGGKGTFLRVIYFIMLYTAYMSTAGSMIAGGVSRYKTSLGSFIKNEKLCAAILIIFFLGASTGIGFMGLSAIVEKGYGMLGALRLPTWFFPLLILGPLSIRRERMKQRNMAIKNTV